MALFPGPVGGRQLALCRFDDETNSITSCTAMARVVRATPPGFGVKNSAMSATSAATSPLTDRLRSALFSRSVIDQAIGIVIGLQHCSPDVAFDVLRAVSQNRNVRLRQVAAELVARTAEPPARLGRVAGPAGSSFVAGC